MLCGVKRKSVNERAPRSFGVWPEKGYPAYVTMKATMCFVDWNAIQ